MELVQKHYVFATPIFVAVGILRAFTLTVITELLNFSQNVTTPPSSHPFFPLDVDVYHIEL